MCEDTLIHNSELKCPERQQEVHLLQGFLISITRGLLWQQGDFTNTKAANRNPAEILLVFLKRCLDLTDTGDAAASVSPTSEEKTKK